MKVILPMLPESGIAVTLVKHHLTPAFSHVQYRFKDPKASHGVEE